MMAPTVAATIELRSSAPSIGSEPSKAPARKSADECADDAQDDVPDDTETLVTLDEEPGQVPGDSAEHQPRDDAHLILHFPRDRSARGRATPTRLRAAARQACRYDPRLSPCIWLAAHGCPTRGLRWARKADVRSLSQGRKRRHSTIGLARARAPSSRQRRRAIDEPATSAEPADHDERPRHGGRRVRPRPGGRRRRDPARAGARLIVPIEAHLFDAAGTDREVGLDDHPLVGLADDEILWVDVQAPTAADLERLAVPTTGSPRRSTTLARASGTAPDSGSFPRYVHLTIEAVVCRRRLRVRGDRPARRPRLRRDRSPRRCACPGEPERGAPGRLAPWEALGRPVHGHPRRPRAQ